MTEIFLSKFRSQKYPR